MRALVFHISSLVALLVLLNKLSGTAEIERTVFMAFATGLVMYTVLMVGFAVARRIVAATPTEDAAEASSGSDAAQTGANELIH